MDSPDALVLAILCDFKGRDEKDVITYILTRLQELTQGNSQKLGQCMLTLEELSTNRDLQTKLKEVESMLRDMKLEELPSYQIGMERGVSQGISVGISQGISQGIISSAIKMITKFKLSIEEVAKELNISIDELKKHLENKQ
jgi:predicted transposase YdaD